MMPAMVNPTWADILSAVSTAASALLTLGLVVLALVAWRTASDALEESRKASLAAQKSAAAAEAANEQLRRDSAEQTRPYVFAEVLPGLAGSPTWDIRISNSGKSSARELTLKPTCWPDRHDMAIRSLRELCEPLVRSHPAARSARCGELGMPPPAIRLTGPMDSGCQIAHRSWSPTEAMTPKARSLRTSST